MAFVKLSNFGCLVGVTRFIGLIADVRRVQNRARVLRDDVLTNESPSNVSNAFLILLKSPPFARAFVPQAPRVEHPSRRLARERVRIRLAQGEHFDDFERVELVARVLQRVPDAREMHGPRVAPRPHARAFFGRVGLLPDQRKQHAVKPFAVRRSTETTRRCRTCEG